MGLNLSSQGQKTVALGDLKGPTPQIVSGNMTSPEEVQYTTAAPPPPLFIPTSTPSVFLTTTPCFLSQKVCTSSSSSSNFPFLFHFDFFNDMHALQETKNGPSWSSLAGISLFDDELVC
jgi:hypothetical protein